MDATLAQQIKCIRSAALLVLLAAFAPLLGLGGGTIADGMWAGGPSTGAKAVLEHVPFAETAAERELVDYDPPDLLAVPWHDPTLRLSQTEERAPPPVLNARREGARGFWARGPPAT